MGWFKYTIDLAGVGRVVLYLVLLQHSIYLPSDVSFTHDIKGSNPFASDEVYCVLCFVYWCDC